MSETIPNTILDSLSWLHWKEELNKVVRCLNRYISKYNRSNIFLGPHIQIKKTQADWDWMKPTHSRHMNLWDAQTLIKRTWRLGPRGLTNKWTSKVVSLAPMGDCLTCGGVTTVCVLARGLKESFSVLCCPGTRM